VCDDSSAGEWLIIDLWVMRKALTLIEKTVEYRDPRARVDDTFVGEQLLQNINGVSVPSAKLDRGGAKFAVFGTQPSVRHGLAVVIT
jgi:hypothetical protein